MVVNCGKDQQQSQHMFVLLFLLLFGGDNLQIFTTEKRKTTIYNLQIQVALRILTYTPLLYRFNPLH